MYEQVKSSLKSSHFHWPFTELGKTVDDNAIVVTSFNCVDHCNLGLYEGKHAHFQIDVNGMAF